MKITKITTLLAWLVVSITGGYLLPQVVVNNGGAIPVSSWNLVFTLPAIGVVLVLMAIPVIQYRRGLKISIKDELAPRPKRVNPFYAVRLVLLAKAISISGAIFVGWHIGLLYNQLTAPVLPTTTGQNALALVGSLVMLVCAIVVERLCRISDSGSTAAGNTEASPA